MLSWNCRNFKYRGSRSSRNTFLYTTSYLTLAYLHRIIGYDGQSTLTPEPYRFSCWRCLTTYDNKFYASMNSKLRLGASKSNSPIIIHCQDGVCKTGIILTVLKSIEELKLRKSTSIFHSVNNLRGQRMSMVPTLVSIVCEYV